MKKIIIQSTVELYIGHGIVGTISEISHRYGNRTALISDSCVSHPIKGELFPVHLKKTREAKQQLEDELFERGFGRDSVLVAIGGGTLTDLVGFVASTYMRGVPLILAPTTLLAMVDAAIGGKTAIDTPHGKNLIGSFYLPKAIIIDLNFLKTLPEKERINGLSEIIKMGLVVDQSILDAEFEDQILKAIQSKVLIVEQDPQEKGLRRILNFGHTIGHAIEFCANYAIAHGVAVALGCIAESYLSFLMGLISQKDFFYIANLFPKYPWTYDHKQLITAMGRDKKNEQGIIRFVLIDKIGHACEFNGAFCTGVPLQKLQEMFAYMEQNYV